MNILSLFDGMSGLQIALNNLGVNYDNYFASEIDKYAIQVTLKNYPKTMQLGDIKTLNVSNLPLIDLISFGSPCQDLSVAKQNRQGLEGERSGLFYEALRILNELKPKYFIVENVASMPKEAKNEITRCLFGIEPVLINSSLLTAQNRKRLYWVGKLNNEGFYEKIIIEQPEDKKILLKDILESGLSYQDKSYTLTASYNGAIFWNTLAKKQRTMILEPIRIGHYNKGGQGDRIYSVDGKSVCLQSNSGGKGAKTGLYKIDLPNGEYLVRKLTPSECEKLQGVNIGYTDCVSNTQRYKMIGNGFTVPIIEHILKKILTKNC